MCDCCCDARNGPCYCQRCRMMEEERKRSTKEEAEDIQEMIKELQELFSKLKEK